MRYLIAFLLFTASAHAQYQVGLQLPKTTYLAMEAINATVTVTNRSGGEVVLGGPGRDNWLSFQMSKIGGYPLGPIEVSGTDMVRIPPGGTIQRKVKVTDAYSPNEMGNYTLTARVLHPPSNQHFASNRVLFDIAEVKPMWEQTYGVPEGYSNAGQIRRYTVSVLRESQSSTLYFRMVDEATKLRLQTFSLGPVSLALDPQITLDKGNNLQILFLVIPQTFCHVVIKPDGTLLKRTYYRDVNRNRPQLTVARDGGVRVAGGSLYDPAAAPAKAKSSKGVSERPPGL